jgi:hypothetical protein
VIADGIEAGDRIGRQRDVTRGHILLEVGDRARARNQQCVRRVGEQPRQPDLRRGGADLVGHLVDHWVVGDVGEARERRSEGKERNPRDALCLA